VRSTDIQLRNFPVQLISEVLSGNRFVGVVTSCFPTEAGFIHAGSVSNVTDTSGHDTAVIGAMIGDGKGDLPQGTTEREVDELVPGTAGIDKDHIRVRVVRHRGSRLEMIKALELAASDGGVQLQNVTILYEKNWNNVFWVGTRESVKEKYRAVADSGKLIVSGAGNANMDVSDTDMIISPQYMSPRQGAGWNKNLVCVAATAVVSAPGDLESRWHVPSSGEGSNYGARVSVVAPGQSILTLNWNGSLPLTKRHRTSPNWRDALRRVSRCCGTGTTERAAPSRAISASFHEMGKF
jgi:hypothetical protein